MKRIKITAICISLLASLSVVGCVCPPAQYFGMHHGYAPNHIPYDGGCDPRGAVGSCGVVEDCGVVEYGGDFCAPRYNSVVDCRTTFSNLSNGILLTGRGVLDVAAAPFVIVGNMLSSGCRYELIKYCDTGFYGQTFFQSAEPCGSVSTSGCASGCESCAGGFTEGVRYNVNTPHQTTTVLPTPLRRSNSVIQAAYQEPTAPAVRFVQPKHTVFR